MLDLSRPQTHVFMKRFITNLYIIEVEKRIGRVETQCMLFVNLGFYTTSNLAPTAVNVVDRNTNHPQSLGKMFEHYSTSLTYYRF